jgi:hypothetical protein
MILACFANTPYHNQSKGDPVPGSERQRELRRRRKRTKTYEKIQSKLATATPSEKAVMAEKLRSMTPGAEELIQRWELEESK